MDTDSDVVFEPDEAPLASCRGVVVTKSKLAELTGFAPVTIDKHLAAGAPIIAKGTRKQGWQINTAAYIGWVIRTKVEEATGDPDTGSFDVAKRRDKESQTRLRDLQIAKLESELVPVADVEAWAAEMYGTTRSRLLAVESQVPGLTDDQREMLRIALTDALADLSGYKMEPMSDDDSVEMENL